ncbi:MAG: xylulokinase [Clostridiales bacterium]|nr:xylulokinase [Clostridiales bacterium]
MKYLIGIDVGTSGTKTVLFDIYGKVTASETVEYPLYQPKNGWAEQEPEDWWNASVEGIKAVIDRSGCDKSEIAGVGLSGQMHGLVMLDKNGCVLRRSIIWCDQRTHEECDDIDNIVGRDKVIEITANPPMTGFTASKILWVKKHEPEIYEKCAHILLPKDYIRFRLTGEYATEVSDASGMQLMDVAKRQWSREILSLLDIDISLLAEMYESPDVTGNVSKSASELTGLPEGIPVAGGAGDNAAAAIGTGIVRSGSAFNTLGSSAVIYAVTDRLNADKKGRVHGLCASVPGKWTLMSCTQGAGISLKWFANNFFLQEKEEAKKRNTSIYNIIDKKASDVPIGSEKLLFLPYLMGERSPHPDAFCRGVFFGLSAIHNREHLVRAVMEGVAFSQRECMDVFRENGAGVDSITLCGGGSRSPVWRQMLADLYSCPVSVLESDEGGALGAALLAGVGAKIYSSVEEAADSVVKKIPAAEPIAENTERYEPYYELYKKLYLSLKENFVELYDI